MIKKLEKIKSWQIIATVATCLVLVFLSICTFNFVRENAARKDGSLSPLTVPSQELELKGMEHVKGDLFKSTTDDSQMRLKKEMKFSTMRFTITYTVDPGEIVLYYKEPEDEHFSSRKRRWVYPDDSVENGYVVSMPMKTVKEIRLDPSMYPGNEMHIGDFVLNEEKSFGEYYNVSYERIFELILYTAVISACLKYALDFLTGNRE